MARIAQVYPSCLICAFMCAGPGHMGHSQHWLIQFDNVLQGHQQRVAHSCFSVCQKLPSMVIRVMIHECDRQISLDDLPHCEDGTIPWLVERPFFMGHA